MTIETLYNNFLDAPEEVKNMPLVMAYISIYEGFISYPNRADIMLLNLYKILDDFDYFYPDVLKMYLNGYTIKEIKLPDAIIFPQWMQLRLEREEEVRKHKKPINTQHSEEMTASIEAEQLKRFEFFLEKQKLRNAGKSEELKKLEEKELHELPSLKTQATSLANSLLGFAKSGFKTVTKEQYDARRKICEGCKFFDSAGFGGMGRCRKCGCSSYKLNMAIAECPIGLWGKIEENPPEEK